METRASRNRASVRPTRVDLYLRQWLSVDGTFDQIEPGLPGGRLGPSLGLVLCRSTWKHYLIALEPDPESTESEREALKVCDSRTRSDHRSAEE